MNKTGIPFVFNIKCEIIINCKLDLNKHKHEHQ